MIFSVVRRLLCLRFVFRFAVFFLVLAFMTGCKVNVAGKQRPLIFHEPIKGELEFVAESRTDKHKSPGIKRKSDLEMLEERLGLETTGDMYHPNFLLYNAAIGLGLTQQSLSSDLVTDKTNASLNDYDVMVRMLQKLSFPVSFYTNKSRHLVPRQFVGSMRSDVQNSGVSLGFGFKDWPMRFQYNTTENRQKALAATLLGNNFFSRKNERLRYSLSHDFSRLSRLNFEFERNEISQSRSTFSSVLKDDVYMMQHGLSFGKEEQHRLGSSLRFFDQSAPFESTDLRWDENVRLQHSSTLLTNYKFSFQDRKRGLSGAQSGFRNKTIRGSAGFEHKLYESLVTTGGIFASESEIGDGDKFMPVQKGGNLGFNYQKKNPWGKLISTYSIASLQNDQTGGSGEGFVEDESHVVPTSAVPEVELNRVNIDITSITVEDGNGIRFQDDDFTISEVNGRVILILRTVGPIDPPDFSPGQEFFVDYSFFIEPERKEDTLRQNFTIKERFDNGLSLFFRHRRQDETVKSTLLEIVPDEYKTNTFGIDYLNKGLTFLAEHSKTNSTFISSTSKRVQASYSWKISPDTRATLQAFSHWLEYGEPFPRNVVLFSSSGKIYGRLTDRYNISAGINYRDEDDSRFGITRGFEIYSELEYNYRQVNITTGVELDMLKRRDVERDSYFFYFRLKRLF
jgi:hypothetical protein